MTYGLFCVGIKRAVRASKNVHCEQKSAKSSLPKSLPDAKMEGIMAKRTDYRVFYSISRARAALRDAQADRRQLGEQAKLSGRHDKPAENISNADIYCAMA